jgi:lipopolysaccharide/colanic/teichoic acid biosynthesis glycosyltransferase
MRGPNDPVAMNTATMDALGSMDVLEADDETAPAAVVAVAGAAAPSLLGPPIGSESYVERLRAFVHAPPGIPLSVRIVKRAIDVVMAAIGLLFAGVLFPFLAIAIRLDSAGPIFYRQRRAAHVRWHCAGTPCECTDFAMLKFRTMRVDAEKQTGAVLAGENDPRITRVGRFLRKTRLDELPQLWNVLLGDMSLVGPRPERPELFENLALAIPFFEERMRDCKPGVTGLAQVSLGYTGRAPADSPMAGMSETLANPFQLPEAAGSDADDMRMKLLFDLAYVVSMEHFSTFIAMELFVIFKTPWVMLRGLGR